MSARYSGLLLLIVAAFALARPAEPLPETAAAPRLAWQTAPRPIGAIAAAAVPRMRITVDAVTEGGVLIYTITMVPGAAEAIPVNYTFSGDTSALVNARGGSGRIPPGKAMTVRAPTVDDNLVNSDRHVVLNAAMPGATGSQGERFRASASGLVRDNDVAPPPPPPPPPAPVLPQVSIGPARPMTEGNTLRFPLRLTAPSDRPVTAFFRLDDPAGVAAAGTGNVATIAAGETVGEIRVDTIDDGAVNGMRMVNVRLVRASGAVLSKPAAARGVVADNDVAPPPPPTYSIAVSQSEVTEGTALTFTVTRSGDLSQPGMISYSQTTAVEGRTGPPVRKTVEFPTQVASRSFDFNPDGPILHDMLVQVILLQNDGEPPLGIGSAQGTIRDDPDNPPKEDPAGPTGSTTGGVTSGGTTSGGTSSGGETIDRRAWYDPIDLGWPLSLIPIVILVCGIAAAIWRFWPDPDLPNGNGISPPQVPDCEIDCTPRWDAPQEPGAIGPLTLPELHFNIRAVPGEPTTPFALGATFLEERDEPDDQL